ncbi:MAG: hypothetical protein ABIR82_11500 [Nocardioides sp.]
MAELGKATFASSVRTNRTAQGARAAGGGLPRLDVPVSLVVTGTPRDGGDAAVRTAEATLQLLGPGDVVGIAPNEILRVFPSDGEHAAEPNYLASVEFDSPELPWLVSLSVDKPTRPWIALVVVPFTPGCYADRPGSMLPWLFAKASDLPPSDETHLWAHAQAQGGADLVSRNPADGRATLSRLVCPSRLQPSTRYLAAVVPTYHAGVLAALRQNPKGAGDKASWGGGAGSVELPIYHQWRFTTGAAGDFEDLARQLKAVDASTIEKLGRIDLRLGEKGLDGLPAGPLPNPLRTLLVSPAEDDMRDGQQPDLGSDVAHKLDDAVDHDADDLVARPPRYGEWPAGDVPVRDGPAWYAQLNLQPHHRVIARLGADLVRVQQEELVADAQRQLGEFRAARRARDLLRLGEMTAVRLHERAFAVAPAARLVTTARPALRAITRDEAPLVARVQETLAVDGLGRSLVATSMARIAQRVSVKAGLSAAQVRVAFVDGSLSGELVALNSTARPPTVDVDRASKAFERAGVLDQQVDGITVTQLLGLAGEALRAQDDLVATLRTERVEIQPTPDAPPELPPDGEPGDVGGLGGLVGPLRHQDLQLHVALNLGGAAEEPAPVEGLRIEGLHVEGLHVEGLRDAVRVEGLRRTSGLRFLRPRALQAIEAEPQFLELAALGAFRGPLGLTADIADLRVAGQATEVVSLVSSATTTLMEGAVVAGLAQVERRPVTDLLVDGATVELATAAAAGADTVVMQLDARDAIRRELGLKVSGPIMRDQLTVEGQHEFDDVVNKLATRQVSGALRFPAAPARVTVAEVADAIRPRLEAPTTYAAAATLRLPFAPGLVPTRIEMGFVPRFGAPLADRLQRARNGWILAGAERVPPNSITVVMTNPEFVEALLVGANHEMARELMWRDLPSDARRTLFTRFWATPPEQPLPELHAWTESLGKNLPVDSPYLCVLVRSPLLRKYPNTVIQAAQGKIEDIPGGGKNFEPTDTFRTRLFQGSIAPDLTFAVLDLTEDEVENDADEWFLMLGEPVTEPKFGLDASPSPSAAGDLWRNLSWDEIGGQDSVLREHEANLANAERDGVSWGTDAAAMARILHQDPFRLVLRAREFVGGGG